CIANAFDQVARRGAGASASGPARGTTSTPRCRSPNCRTGTPCCSGRAHSLGARLPSSPPEPTQSAAGVTVYPPFPGHRSNNVGNHRPAAHPAPQGAPREVTRVPVPAATLPPFTNRATCARCHGRREIRVHFVRDCADVRGAHFHHQCPCGFSWIERGAEEPLLDQPRGCARFG